MTKIHQKFATIFLVWYCCIKFVKTNKHYKEVFVDTEDCFVEHRKEIILDYNTAVNLTLYYINDYYHNRWKNRKCHYRLQPANHHSGIFATIQELSLQRRGNGCFAFVEFVTGKRSKQLCGTLTARNVMNIDEQDFHTQSDNNTFVSTVGPMDINIIIPKEAMDQDIKINIVFTIYEYCIDNPKHHKPCLEARELCIHENFFNDGVVNCPFFGCVDEGSCVQTRSSQSLEYNLFYCVMTFMIFFFAIFFVGFSIFWMYGRGCCSKPSSTSNPTEAQVTRVTELDVPSEFENMNGQTSSDNEDKDLPPSYESLFSSR